jgi:hypothetical protein
MTFGRIHLPFSNALNGFLLAICALGVGVSTGCAPPSQGGTDNAQKQVESYCPLLPSRSFSSFVTVEGKAFYEYRIDGNLYVANGSFMLRPTEATNNATYSVSIGSVTASFNCPNPCNSGGAAATIVEGVANAINSDATLNQIVTASRNDEFGAPRLLITPKVYGTAIDLDTSALVRLSVNDLSGNRMHGEPNPIRHAEIRVTSSNGTILQCAETDQDGAFSFPVPHGGGDYLVSIASRSNNDKNTAYVLNNPTNNEFYAISQTVISTSNTTGIRLVASATGTMEGAAFNILDQIHKSQDYLRSQTAGCATTYSGCIPFTTAPIVYAYWMKGFNPGSYVGVAGSGISFYLNGKRELYILGGLNGNVDSADMDHFDNSVIIHEYAHFLEDQFGNPNSPGGSHNGNSVIDPRLAWGEGWANFFQGAVLSRALYRDTYGRIGCTTSQQQSTCTGHFFNEPLNPEVGSNYNDKPVHEGEGNFREFSVARLLYRAASGPMNAFAHIWAAFHGANSMRTANDSFKSIGRFHVIQNLLGTPSENSDWNSLRTAEMHRADLRDYASPLLIPGSSCSTPMTVRAVISSNPNITEIIDQFSNNDFYVYSHPGGNLNVLLEWTGVTDKADLDLFIYRPGYVYGNIRTVAAHSEAGNSGPSGTEYLSRSLPAGTYLINVKAYTGRDYYPSSTTTNVTYTLKINGQLACPNY